MMTSIRGTMRNSVDWQKTWWLVSLQAIFIATLVMTTSVVGILTRPVGFLAAFWPANALLMGVMIRYRFLDRWWGWLAAFAGYMAADLITGGTVLITLWLTMGNLAGVLTGIFCYRQLTEEDRHLQRPPSVLYLFLICVASGVAAATVGGGAAPVLFGRSWQTGFNFWFTTELVNSILILPVILTAPKWREFQPRSLRFFQRIRQDPWLLGPVSSLIISAFVSLIVGGPGAIVFAVPALLWCALSYSLFGTALLTFLYCSWTMIAVSAGLLVIHPVSMDYIDATSSIRLGISLLALGPLTAASINTARNQLLKNLDHAVNHDCLTDILVRSAFMNSGEQILKQSQAEKWPTAVFMMDIDHFKNINDQHGHLVGDQALISFTKVVMRCLRPTDLFGRLGGEEFAVVLPHVSPEDADCIAERLRGETEKSFFQLPQGGRIRLTVSIGVYCPAVTGQPLSLDTVLSRADQALYKAKHLGRNRSVRLPSPDEKPGTHSSTIDKQQPA